MRSCLERALQYLTKAALLWPRFTDVVYTQAKCHALLGEAQEAKQNLENLSDRDRRYFAKASQDGDFESIQAEIEGLFARALESPGPRARAAEAKLGEVGETVEWARRSAPESAEDRAAVARAERFLKEAKASLTTLGVDIEDLQERLDRLGREMEEMARGALQLHVKNAKEAISTCEERKRGLEHSIGQLKETMRSTSGAPLGCLLSALTVIFVFPIVLSVFSSMFPLPRSATQALVPYVVLTDVIGGIAVGIIVSKISRDQKNRPYRRQVEEAARGIQECTRTLPSLQARAKQGEREMNEFMAWKAQRASR
jgi:hypothetical protein